MAYPPAANSIARRSQASGCQEVVKSNRWNGKLVEPEAPRVQPPIQRHYPSWMVICQTAVGAALVFGEPEAGALHQHDRWNVENQP